MLYEWQQNPTWLPCLSHRLTAYPVQNSNFLRRPNGTIAPKLLLRPLSPSLESFQDPNTPYPLSAPPPPAAGADRVILAPMAGTSTPARSSAHPMAATSTPARYRSSARSSLPVRIVLRVRPFLPSEAASATAPCVSLLSGHPGGEVTVHLKDQHTRYALTPPQRTIWSPRTFSCANCGSSRSVDPFNLPGIGQVLAWKFDTPR